MKTTNNTQKKYVSTETFMEMTNHLIEDDKDLFTLIDLLEKRIDIQHKFLIGLSFVILLHLLSIIILGVFNLC